MYPTLFTVPGLPEGWGDIKSYGFMLMLGFLSAIWLACRRAMRVQADPDIVLNIGLVSLIFGVVGARIYFVWHYWDTQFANQPNPWFAAFRIDRGGLEFWGGPLLAIPAVMYYVWRAKASVRWYLDIVAPSLMWGLAFGRIGCLLNGCCWGSVCLDPADPERHRAGLPWAITFPYGSPAMTQQYWFRQMTLPKELIYILPTGESIPLPREYMEMSRDQIDGPAREVARAEQSLEAMRRGGANDATTQAQEKKLTGLRDALRRHNNMLYPLTEVQRRYEMTPAELAELSTHYRSLPVQPSQIYGILNALLISWLLSVMFYRRARHGIVFGWMLVFKGVTRFLLEAIRQDNPLDVANLTLSQSVSLGMILFAAAYFVVIYRLPLNSPAARPFVYEEDEPRPAASPA